MPTANTTATRPENCQYTKFDFVPEKPTSPTRLQYCGKHLAVGIIGEAFVRKMGLESTLRLSNAARKFDRLTDLRRFIPFANGKEIPHQPPKPSAPGSRHTPRTGNAASVESTTAAPASSAQSSSTTAAPASSAPSATTTTASTHVASKSLPSRAWQNISSSLAGNADWLLLTGGIAVTSAAINQLTTNRIKNDAARNIFSVLGGATIVWGAAFGLSYFGYANPVEFSKTVDIGARLLAYHSILKMVTPGAQTSMYWMSRALTPLRTSFAYESPKAKAKTA